MKGQSEKRRRIRAPWTLACALAVASLAVAGLGSGEAAGQATALESFPGTYVFAGGQRERDRLHAAIDSVVDRLNVFIREIARGEIRRNLTPEPRVVISRASERGLRIQVGDWGPLEVPLNGRATRVTGPDGSDTRLSARFSQGRIRTHQASGRGTRENWLSLSGDLGHLFLQVRVNADQLPAAIRYTLTYRRQG